MGNPKSMQDENPLFCTIFPVVQDAYAIDRARCLPAFSPLRPSTTDLHRLPAFDSKRPLSVLHQLPSERKIATSPLIFSPKSDPRRQTPLLSLRAGRFLCAKNDHTRQQQSL